MNDEQRVRRDWLIEFAECEPVPGCDECLYMPAKLIGGVYPLDGWGTKLKCYAFEDFGWAFVFANKHPKCWRQFRARYNEATPFRSTEE